MKVKNSKCKWKILWHFARMHLCLIFGLVIWIFNIKHHCKYLSNHDSKQASSIYPNIKHLFTNKKCQFIKLLVAMIVLMTKYPNIWSTLWPTNSRSGSGHVTLSQPMTTGQSNLDIILRYCTRNLYLGSTCCLFKLQSRTLYSLMTLLLHKTWYTQQRSRSNLSTHCYLMSKSIT